jgi:phage shock protein A
VIEALQNGERITLSRLRETLSAEGGDVTAQRMMVIRLEGALAAARSIASSRLADRALWQRRLADALHRQSKWDEKAKLACAKGREDLAAGATREKNQASAELAILEVEADLINELVRNSEDEIAHIQLLIRELRPCLISRFHTSRALDH